jgi:predicted metal-dependent hydrolase
VSQKEHLNDPAYYEKMSALLDEIIVKRKAKAIEYEEYLQSIAELAKKTETGYADDIPEELKDSPGIRALYNNLQKTSGDYKDIKNLYLNVYPPMRSVRIAAPLWMKLDTIRIFAISKLAWIKQQQKKLQEQKREPVREYLDRESHYVWGKRCLLKIIESNLSSTVELKNNKMLVQIPPRTSAEKTQILIEEWYRAQLKQAIPALIAKWEPLIHVKVERFFTQRMKTKWGSCNPNAKSIRLNTELAKKPLEYLEYIIVHEMAHLLEPRHNHFFITLMDRLMPKWRFYREELNHSLLGHEQWKY